MSSYDVTDPAYDIAVAIVGMAGRFPGAGSVDELWGNVVGGVRSIRDLSDGELRGAGVSEQDLNDAAYVKAGAPLAGIEEFDAGFFGYPPREAEVMDPQHRLFLECAWQALEHAGYDPTNSPGLVGTFAGSAFQRYLTVNLGNNDTVVESMTELELAIGNERDALASTVSYKLNLRGPAVAVQTFCSTSLVATHLACQSLLTYECDMALAGGVAISVPHGVGYRFQEGGIVSPDGHCRVFDAQAHGSVMGSGVGVVVLKRLADAIADGDTMYAVVRGSAINNDGVRKVGYTAPGLAGQASVIATALSRAEVSADTIDYIEAHGTATPLGDAVELEALKQAFARTTDRTQFCALGSVKANIGHLDRAAGITGLIKTALALHHAQLPPQIEYREPAPDSDLDHSPFYINTTPSPWPETDHPRRAGVSAFGLGGTNAHVVLEQAPTPTPTPSPPQRRPHELLIVSAKTQTALDQSCTQLADHLRTHPEQPLADVAHTLQVGRTHFNHRRAITAQTHLEAAAELQQPRTSQTRHQTRGRVVSFVMTPDGLDPQADADHGARKQDLFGCEPAFASSLDRLCEDLGTDLRAQVGLALDGDQTGMSLSAAARILVALAFADLWRSWVGAPQTVAGTGEGALAAAAVAAAISPSDALLIAGGELNSFRFSTAHTPVLVGNGWLTARDGSDPAFWLDRLHDPPQPPSEARQKLAEQGQHAIVIGELKPHAELLDELGEAWLAGVEVNWHNLASGRSLRRVPLPTYPFERRRHWVEPNTPPGPLPVRPSTGKVREPADWFYVPSWRSTTDLDLISGDKGVAPPEWLIFVEEGTLGPRVAQQLGAHSSVVRVRHGRQFERHGTDEFTIDPGRQEDFTRLLAALDRPPQAILFLWSLEVSPDVGVHAFARAQEIGFYSLLNIVKSLSDRSVTSDVRLCAVTRNVRPVTHTEEIQPAGAPVAGALNVIAQENLNIETYHVDVDCPPPGTWQEQRLADLLTREVTTPQPRTVAFRGNQRWVEGYDRVALPQRRSLRNRGVYLITGGLGGVGLTLAEHLASTTSARILITTHRGLPPETEWSAWHEEHSSDDTVSTRIRAVQRIRDLGAEVLVVEADASDAIAMGRAIRLAHERFGPLNGVIHAAGASGPDAFVPIQNTERPACERHFGAKARALYVLEDICGGERLDFCVLFSSLASILGGLGFVGYSAANSFVDSFVHRHNRLSPQRWTAVNWDTWQVSDTGHGDLGGTLVEYAMTKPEAIDAFERVAGYGDRFTQLVNSTGDLDTRLDQWVREVAGRADGVTPLHARPDLGTPYLAPRDDTERVIVNVWEEIFGTRVGVDDPFLDLGGNSLLGTRVIARLRKAFKINIPLLLLFEAPTVSQMAVEIKSALMDEIERLDEGEAVQLRQTGDNPIERE